MRRRAVAVTAILTAGIVSLPGTPGADERRLNLYDWMFRAPIVVGGQALDASGKATPVVVEHVVRGSGIEPGAVLPVRVATANRNRKDFQRRVKLEPDLSYLFLLREHPPKKADGEMTYDLVRGVRGAREIPSEGASAYLEAAERFARMQDQNLDSLAWDQFERMLEDTNPFMVETALEEYIQFDRGAPDLVPALRPLLMHPRPDIRERVLRLAGRILERYPVDEIPDPQGFEIEVIALARRDPAVEVRVAATEALRGLADPGVSEIWEEISRDDPEQEVRYAAERLLFELSGDPGGEEGSDAVQPQ